MEEKNLKAVVRLEESRVAEIYYTDRINRKAISRTHS